MPDQLVSAIDILKDAGADQPVTEGTFLQRTGLILAGFVGGVIAVVILMLVGKWVFSSPKLPPIPSNADPATVKAMLENYKALQQITLDPLTALFDSVVVKVLLPVFTSILGYIFGTRDKRDDE